MAPWTVSGPDVPVSADTVDVLIDTTAAPALWAPLLARVRPEGRVALLTPPGAQVCRFDFYPGVHRRSLSLLARRVPTGQHPLVTEDAYRLFPRFLEHVSGVLEEWPIEEWSIEVEARSQPRIAPDRGS
jgi:threonine dehydrogenase-like Zn-dependent dehydrogenase